MRISKNLLRPPRLRAETDGDERHATWLELFFDLAYVAAISQLTHLLAVDFSPQMLLRYVLLFVPVWWSWVGQVFYLSRFDSEDIGHRVISFVHIVLIAYLATTVEAAAKGDYSSFVFAYAAMRMLLVLEYVIAGLANPEARKLCWVYSLGFFIAAIMWAASGVSPAPISYGLWVLALGTDIFTPFLLPDQNVKFRPHPTHVPERFGLFTIIILGEAILAAVSSVPSDRATPYTLGLGFAGLFTAFALWWIYFFEIEAHQPRTPVNPRQMRRYRLWMYSHLPFAIGIGWLAAAIRQALERPPGTILPAYQTWMVTGAMLTVLFSIYFLWLGVVGSRFVRTSRFHNWPHEALSCACVPLSTVAPALPISMSIGTFAGIMFGHILIGLREYPEGICEGSIWPEFLGHCGENDPVSG